MGNVINLRTIRKRRNKAAENAAKDMASKSAGVKKTAKLAAKNLNEHTNKKHDGHRREDVE